MAHQVSESEAWFVSYVEALTTVVGDARRVEPLKHYCSGLLTAEGRKSVEPLAAVTTAASVRCSTRSC
jgi:SRSO17 transposase